MGIRFRCPNGHTLHVKAFLAGKRGICPECGQKFTIPETSDPELVAGRTAKKAVEKAVGSVSIQTVSPQTASPRTASSQTVSSKIVTAQPARNPVVKPDPDSELVGGNWYVRPPAGGQFGPANEALFAQWVAEGRIPHDSFVWREGWTDWQPATKILPPAGKSVAKAAPVPPATPKPAPRETPRADIATAARPSASESPAVLPKVVVNNAESPAIGSYRRQKASRTMGIVIAILTVACIALFAALIFVIRG